MSSKPPGIAGNMAWGANILIAQGCVAERSYPGIMLVEEYLKDGGYH